MVNEDVDDDLFNEIEELNKTKNSKVQFKKKLTSNKKILRSKLSFQDDNDDVENNNDNDNYNDTSTIIPTSKILFKKKLTKSTTPETKRRPINLDKYRTNQKVDEEELLLELDDEDPENNPTIVNIDELKDPKLDKIRQKYNSDMLPPLPPQEQKKYVPIETNRDPNEDIKMSVRKYANELINEYKDEKNYDDGTEKQEKEEQIEIDNDDIQLIDEDMGTLNTKIDFDNKFNFEIQTDHEEEDNDDDDRNDNTNVEMKIPTVKEQIENITGLIKQFEITNREKQNLMTNLKIEKEELSQKKHDLIEELNRLVI